MEQKTLAVLVTIGFSMVGVLGDYFLKLASGKGEPLKSAWFYVGFAVYASTALWCASAEASTHVMSLHAHVLSTKLVYIFARSESPAASRPENSTR